MSTFWYKSIGKRKTSQATLWLTLGCGQFVINSVSFRKFFFKNLMTQMTLFNTTPFLLKITTIYNITVSVTGGGIMSQCDAVLLALAKVFLKVNLTNYKAIINYYRLLNYDNRIKEIRRYGLKKARKASQYSKR